MRFPGVKRFEVTATKDEIILRPAKAADMEAVWAKLEALGLTEDDMADAVQWARKR